MSPQLFGRECSQREGRRLIWRGRGRRVDVYPTGATWAWHLCISHERQVVVDRISPFQHPTSAAALRSVSATIRSLGRAAELIMRDGEAA